MTRRRPAAAAAAAAGSPGTTSGPSAKQHHTRTPFPLPPRRQYVFPTKIADEQVALARRVIQMAGMSEALEPATARKAGQRGPYWTGLTNEAILVGLALSVMNREGLAISNVTDILHRRITAKMRKALGVTRPYETAKQKRAAYKAVLRRWHALLDYVDPSPLPLNAVLYGDELIDRSRPMSEEEIAEKDERLFLLSNRLLDATWRLVPRKYRRQWQGSLTADATFFSAYAVGFKNKSKPDNDKKHSTDPQAAWYMRTRNTISEQRGEQTIDVGKYGYELTIALTASDTPQDKFRQAPNIALGMRVHRPGTEPGNHLLRVLRDIRSRRDLPTDLDLMDSPSDQPQPDPDDPDATALGPLYPAGLLAVDRAYPNCNNFMVQARELQYKPVIDYRIDQLGKIQESINNAILVDGTWYSPSLPAALVTCTHDFRKGQISEADWRKRLQQRVAYELVANGRPDSDGYQRWFCPAAAPKPRVKCPLKTAFAPARSSLLPVLPPRTVRPGGETHGLGICGHQTTTIPPDYYGKFWQHLRHESAEWHATYSTLRNCMEGYNGYVKDHGYEGLDDADKRRIRGIASATISAAFILMAANIRTIQKFLDNAKAREDGTVGVTVVKRIRKRRRQRDKRDAVKALHGAPTDPAVPD